MALAAQAFPIRYGVFRPLLSILGAGPRWSGVEIDGDTLRARMGWMFGVDVPAGVDHRRRAVQGPGGWDRRARLAGDPVVNGGTRKVVDIAIDPPARAGSWACPCRCGGCRSA